LFGHAHCHTGNAYVPARHATTRIGKKCAPSKFRLSV
jgi:hypothetical protein